MTIEDFILERVKDHETVIRRTVKAQMVQDELIQMCTTIRLIVDWHQNFPVLVEGPMQFEPPTYSAETPGDFVTYTMSQQMAWMTQQEYIKVFGTDPPTAPLLRQIANQYSWHPDFNMEWEI